MIKITGKGTPESTRIYLEDGREISGELEVFKITIGTEVDKPWVAVLYCRNVEVDIECEAKEDKGGKL